MMLRAMISMVPKGRAERITPLIFVRTGHVRYSIKGSHTCKLFCILQGFDCFPDYLPEYFILRFQSLDFLCLSPFLF